MDRFLKPRDPGAAEREKGEREALLDKARGALRRMWPNYQDFRQKQADAIMDVLSNKDVLCIMPTGGGKTMIFAVPAMLGNGITIVISPLLALAADQVSNLLTAPGGGIPCAYLNSSVAEKTRREIMKDLERGDSLGMPYLKLLFVTPEALVKSEALQRKLHNLAANGFIDRFVIDEAHCISEWGHDFRKEYAEIGYVRDEWPEVPILALTATASRDTVKDIQYTLQIDHRDTCVHYGGIDRQNLHFEVRDKAQGNAKATMYNVLHFITQEDGGKHRDETGIVYSLSRDNCEELAKYLKAAGIQAEYYHAERAETDKKTVQTGWQEGKIKVVCATIAYGMGIDKLNCRYVLHTTMSKSLEGYYQEAGRAGRDGLPAQCVIYWSPKDEGKLLNLIRSNPMKRKAVLLQEEKKLTYMTAYCADHVNNSDAAGDCRRQHFSDRFGHEKPGTRVARCKTKCDNCLEYRRQSVQLPTEESRKAPVTEEGAAKKRKVGAYDDDQNHEAEFDSNRYGTGGTRGDHPPFPSSGGVFRTGKDLLGTANQSKSGFMKASALAGAGFSAATDSVKAQSKPKTAPSSEVIDLT